MTNNLSFVKQLNTKMREHQFMFSYRGEISQEITKSLLFLTERKLEIDGSEISTKKKVFNVMVECLQNISKHSDESYYNKEGLFMIGKIDNQYIIYSGNVISIDIVNDLENKLQALNVMGKEDLSTLYKQIMYDNHIGDKGNAGLGLIDIAKKSGNKLEYQFVKLTENQYYFTLKTSINN